jgi:hypothetical protein
VKVLAEDPHGAGEARGRRLKSAFPLAGLVVTPAAVRPARSALTCQSRAAAAWSLLRLEDLLGLLRAK